ncbi:hypothetical protein [uncultured Eubacterium sp.]|uniref:hypothetical protein n=1 Tax=uncultured Eubacterium sp. TaxID=165185 RepID=UPI002594038D|nr:hypothetical protein [uncultured Eubacterium sp.]
MKYRTKKSHKLVLMITAVVMLVSLIISRYVIYGVYVCLISSIFLCGVCIVVIRDILAQLKEYSNLSENEK